MEKLEYALDPIELKSEDHHHHHTELLDVDVVSKGSPNMITSGDEDVEYTFKNSKGYLYKVVHLQSETDQTIPDGNINTTNTISPGQCQLYVISNQGNEFVPTTGHRTILPKTTNCVKTTGLPSNIKKRDERRRATHNEVERRRRDKINNWIMKLSKILPDTNPEMGASSNTHYEGLSKGGILAKAFEYISELKDANNSLSECLKDNDKIALENIRLIEANDRLRRDNELLRAQIAQHGIAPAPDTIDS